MLIASLALFRILGAMEGIEGDPLAALTFRIVSRVVAQGSCLGRGREDPLSMLFPSFLVIRMSINISWIILLSSGAKQSELLMAGAHMKMPILLISISLPW